MNKISKYILLLGVLMIASNLFEVPLTSAAVQNTTDKLTSKPQTQIFNLKASDPAMFYILVAHLACESSGVCLQDKSIVDNFPLFSKITIVDQSRKSNKIIINDKFRYRGTPTSAITIEVERSFFNDLSKELSLSGINVQVTMAMTENSYIHFYDSAGKLILTRDFTYSIK